MKLIRCHVEAYGKIKSQDFVFNKGLTTFYFGNGHGKSTLVSFIRAMFFGLRPVRANTKDFEDRRHFYPFDGGKFGGNITFEFNGKTYKVERFFDAKSDTKDTLAVYRNGALTDELGENIGYTVFGLDPDSFERTVLMSANDAHFGSTHGVSSKLGSFALGDDAGFEKAFSVLESKKKQIKAIKGHNDLISRESGKIRELEIKIENLTDMQDELDRYYAERREISQTIERLSAEEKRLNSKKLLFEKKSTYARYVSEISEKENRITAITDRYPTDLMPPERVAQIKQRISDLNREMGASSAVLFTQQKLDRLNTLSSQLGGCESLDGDIASIEASLKRCAEISAELASDKGESRLGDRFGEKIPSAAEIEEQKKNAEKYQELSKLSEELVAGKSKKRINAPLAIIGFIALIAGIALVFSEPIIGGITAAAALVLLLCSLLIKGDAKRLASLMSQSGECESKLRDFLRPYGYDTAGRGGAAYDFSRFLSDLDQYREDSIGAERRRVESSRLLTERDALIKRSLASLSSYGIKCESTEDGVSQLKSLADEYKSLMREYGEASSRKRGFDNNINSANRAIVELLEGHAVVLENGKKIELASLFVTSPSALPAILEQTEIDRAALTSAQRDLVRLKETAERYRSYNGLDASDANEELAQASTEEGTLLTEISALPEKIEALARLDRTISEIEAIVEFLPEHKNELETSKERLDDLKHQNDILVATMNALAQAERNLSEKYIAPVRDKFLNYASQIEESIGDSYTMDREFNLRFEEAGELRDERHLSQGQHAVVALALRLSLVDAMYEGDPPFIVLDDPFASIDEKHFEKVSRLLKKIEKTHQIVYFTCHNSRKI